MVLVSFWELLALFINTMKVLLFICVYLQKFKRDKLVKTIKNAVFTDL